MLLWILYVEGIWDRNTIEVNRRIYTRPEDALAMRSNFGPCEASLAHNARILESGKNCVPLVSLWRGSRTF